MGGRLDATNIINPIAAVVTNISLDHTEYLGDTRAKIAAEKAGIAKENTPMILGEFDNEILPVFQEKCQQVNAPLFLATLDYPVDWVCDLKGRYQKKNLKTVYNLLSHLPFTFDSIKTKEAIANAAASTNLLGRWQIFKKAPLTILDTAHNKAGIKEVMEQLRQENFKRLFMVFGVVNDKDLNSIIPLLPKKAIYLSCQPPVARAMPSNSLHLQLTSHGLHSIYFTKIEHAYRAALNLAQDDDCIFIGGSTFTVGGFLERIQEKKL